MDKLIGEKLKKLRESSGFNQEQLSKYLDIDQTYLSKIESGNRNVSAPILEKLAILYNINLSDFELDEPKAKQIRFCFRAKDIDYEDLKCIATINEIANNSAQMAEMMEKSNEE